MLKQHLQKLHRYKKLLTHKWTKWVVAALACVVAWLVYAGSVDMKPPVSAVHVKIASVKRQDVPIQVQLVGTVVPYETVSIKSRLDSQITDVHFHDGDSVKEGQTMFDLDDRAIVAQIGQLEAALQKEKAQLTNAELQYNRSQNLIKTHVVSQANVDETKAAYEAQAAQVNAAQANLDNTRVQLTYTKILAPISGRTGTINVTRGNNVKANDTQALVTINQITPIRVQFAIAQRYYDQVRTALSSGDIVVKAQNKDSKGTEEGKLEYLDNSIDVSSGTFAARGVFTNQDEKLWPGMFVNITVDLGVEKNVLTIPAVAVQGDEGKRFVFTVAKDDKSANGDKDKIKKAVRTPIELSLNNGDIAIVTKGLEDTDQVIVDGILRVTDGAVLDISNPAP